MRLDYHSILDNLQQVSEKMKDDELNFGLIGCIGNIPNQIGKFFADFFECENHHLSSLRRKRNKVLAGMVNPTYKYISEEILKIISQLYKKAYSLEDIPAQEFNLDKEFYMDRTPILLVMIMFIQEKLLKHGNSKFREKQAEKYILLQ